MGYTTDFSGQVRIDPPLNQAEIDFLNKFARTRRVQRTKGPYYVEDDGCGVFKPGQVNLGGEADVTDMNRPPEGQPGLWCQWVPTADGEYLEWDGGEKFYDSEAWMQYIIEHFLMPGCIAKAQLPFLQDNHICNGEIEAQGEDPDDIWKLVVENNVVRSVDGFRSYRD